MLYFHFPRYFELQWTLDSSGQTAVLQSPFALPRAYDFPCEFDFKRAHHLVQLLLTGSRQPTVLASGVGFEIVP